MKKFACIFVFFVCSLLSLSVFAYISGKTPTAEKMIYCPQQIICSEKGNLSSCKYSSDTPEYWGSLEYSSLGNDKGTYKFNGLASQYHNKNETQLQTSCSYTLIDNPATIISLSSKPQANLEAYYDKTTQWGFSSDGGASCYSSNVHSCPLKQLAGFGVTFKRSQEWSDGIVIYIDHNRLNNFGRIDDDNSVIRYGDVGNCWSLKKCKFDLELQSYKYGNMTVGSVIVDMDNKMKITEIIPNHSAGIEFKKSTPFNVIEISRLNPPPSEPVLEIDNLIKLSIGLYVNNTPITSYGEKPQIYYHHDIVKACPNLKECTLQLRAYTSSGHGLIGSVVLDMENNMKILSVHTERVSEIRINEIDDHKLEVSYPNRTTKLIQ